MWLWLQQAPDGATSYCFTLPHQHVGAQSSPEKGLVCPEGNKTAWTWLPSSLTWLPHLTKSLRNWLVPTFLVASPGPGREEGKTLLTDPQSQSPAPIPALPAFCFATRTWAPSSPQSLAYRLSQGESSLRQRGWMRDYAQPHHRPPACLTGSPLPWLCHSLRTWLGVVALSCHGSRPTLGALGQPEWGTKCSASSWAHPFFSLPMPQFHPQPKTYRVPKMRT